MPHVIECAGHPRDMGLDQGRACRADVRDQVKRAGLPVARSPWLSLAAFTSGVVRGSGAGRETVRHFTHLSERIDGLARSAAVSVDSLLDLHIRAASQGAGTEILYEDAHSLAGCGLDGVSGATVVRSLPGSAGAHWVVRRSRPEVGFSSVEVTLPWLVTAVTGVNEAGLCVSFVPVGSTVEVAPEAAPSILLVQECLQRFDSIQACIEWCRSRPVSGDGTLHLADASGGLSAVSFVGTECTVAAPEDGLMLAGAPSRTRDSLWEAASRERIVDVKALAAISVDGAPPAFVRLDAARHLCVIRSLGGRVDEMTLEA
jgi:hypothetical protein